MRCRPVCSGGRTIRSLQCHFQNFRFRSDRLAGHSAAAEAVDRQGCVFSIQTPRLRGCESLPSEFIVMITALVKRPPRFRLRGDEHFAEIRAVNLWNLVMFREPLIDHGVVRMNEIMML